MFYLLKILLIVCFFALPVQMGWMTLPMWNFLWLGLRSPFPGFLFCALAFAGIIYLLLIFSKPFSKYGIGLSLLALLLLAMPPFIVIFKENQFRNSVSAILYAVFFILLISNFIIVLRSRIAHH